MIFGIISNMRMMDTGPVFLKLATLKFRRLLIKASFILSFAHMKTLFLDSARPFRLFRQFPALLWIIPIFALSGCISPIALNRAVGAYDEAIVSAASKQLLMNIARAHQRQPIHFTGVSNIAATFDFRFSAGGTPALTGNAGGLLMPVFGGSVAENPTISIVPIEGEEFTKRLLTPFQQSKLTLLLRQRYDIDLLLRLMAQEVRIRDPSGNYLSQHAIGFDRI